MVDVTLPGTGGMIPLGDRWLTCCLIEYQGKALLIDCGEGTQIALRKAGFKLSRLDTLLITHFHADHIAGLPGLLLSVGNSGKTTPLTIIGPAGLKEVVSALTVIAPLLPFSLEILECDKDRAGELKKGEFHISYLPLDHRIPCFGYRITITRKPMFNPEKAENLQIPKPFYKRLHERQPVMLEDGRKIEPYMVLDGERPPIRICYCTDTVPVDIIANFARGVDLLISEGMYGDDGMRDKTYEKGHMLFSDSAKIAKDSGAKRLWLTHYSPALKNPEEHLEAARKIFPESVAAYDGIRIALG